MIIGAIFRRISLLFGLLCVVDSARVARPAPKALTLSQAYFSEAAVLTPNNWAHGSPLADSRDDQTLPRAEDCAAACADQSGCSWFVWCDQTDGCKQGNQALEHHQCRLLGSDCSLSMLVEPGDLGAGDATSGFPLPPESPLQVPGWATRPAVGMKGSDFECAASVLPGACAFPLPLDAAAVCGLITQCRAVVVHLNGTDGCSSLLSVLKNSQPGPDNSFVGPSVYTIEKLNADPMTTTYLLADDAALILPTEEGGEAVAGEGTPAVQNSQLSVEQQEGTAADASGSTGSANGSAPNGTDWLGCIVARNALMQGAVVETRDGLASEEACCRACRALGRRCNAWNFCPKGASCSYENMHTAVRLQYQQCELRFQELAVPELGWPPGLIDKGPSIPFSGGSPLSVTGPDLPGYTRYLGAGLINKPGFSCPGSLKPELGQCVLRLPLEDQGAYCQTREECTAVVYKAAGVFNSGSGVGIFKQDSNGSSIVHTPSSVTYFKIRNMPAAAASSHSLSPGAFAGLAVGAAAAAATITAVAALLVVRQWRRRRREGKPQPSCISSNSSLKSAEEGDSGWSTENGASASEPEGPNHLAQSQSAPAWPQQQAAPADLELAQVEQPAQDCPASSQPLPDMEQPAQDCPAVASAPRMEQPGQDSTVATQQTVHLEQPMQAPLMRKQADLAPLTAAFTTEPQPFPHRSVSGAAAYGKVAASPFAALAQLPTQPQDTCIATVTSKASCSVSSSGSSQRCSFVIHAATEPQPSSFTEQHSSNSCCSAAPKCSSTNTATADRTNTAGSGSSRSSDADALTSAPLAELLQYRAMQDSLQPRRSLSSACSDAGIEILEPEVAALSAQAPCAMPAELQKWVIDPRDVELIPGPDGSLQQLGAGASGAVFKAMFRGEVVAVKELDIGQGPDAQAAFVTEAMRMELLRHPNVVTFFGVVINEKLQKGLLILECCEGRDLHSALQLQAAAPGSAQRLFGWHLKGRRVALEVAKALNYLHSLGLVHLDLKSCNVLLTGSGTAKLADMGLSRLKHGTFLSDLAPVGTFAWTAPEVLWGHKCDQSVDIYGFGVLLWEICTGERPVRGDLRLPLVPQECPQDVCDLVLLCMHPDPQQRPTAQQLVQQLGQLARGRSAISPAAASPVSTKQQATRQGRNIAAAAAAAAYLAASSKAALTQRCCVAAAASMRGELPVLGQVAPAAVPAAVPEDEPTRRWSA